MSNRRACGASRTLPPRPVTSARPEASACPQGQLDSSPSRVHLRLSCRASTFRTSDRACPQRQLDSPPCRACCVSPPREHDPRLGQFLSPAAPSPVSRDRSHRRADGAGPAARASSILLRRQTCSRGCWRGPSLARVTAADRSAGERPTGRSDHPLRPGLLTFPPGVYRSFAAQGAAPGDAGAGGTPPIICCSLAALGSSLGTASMNLRAWCWASSLTPASHVSTARLKRAGL